MIGVGSLIFPKLFLSLPPVITAITPSTGSTAGGTAITNLAGTGFQSGATVTIGGVAATGVTFVSSTQLTCTAPAGTAGAQNVVVTNPDAQTSGTSGNGLFTYAAPFTPASLSPDGWWRDYAGAPWVPTAPGDAHGNLVQGSGTTTVGSAVNGHTPAHFNAVSPSKLITASASSNFITAANATVIALFRPTSPTGLTPDQVAWYSENPIITTDGGDFGFSNSVSGVRGGDGTGAHNTPYVPLANNVWGMCAFRVSGGTGKVRVSQASGTVDSTATAMGVTVDSFLQLGINWNGTVFQTGDFLEILAFKRALSDAELVSIMGYFNSEYGFAFT